MLSDAAGPFLIGWTAMMAVMMLPSALPMIRLYSFVAAQEPRPGPRTAVFVSGYLLVWASVGLVVWVLGRAVAAIGVFEFPVPALAATLLLAGAYQLTPLKSACLRACRSPMDFLLTHWYGGTSGALRLGVAHGWYCLGCCWALMALLVFVGAMAPAWVVAVAALVFVEKVLPRGPLIGRGVGVALMTAAVVVLARPELAMMLTPGME